MIWKFANGSSLVFEKPGDNTIGEGMKLYYFGPDDTTEEKDPLPVDDINDNDDLEEDDDDDEDEDEDTDEEV